MAKKWILVEPAGGLGNRLRVIASALIAAEEQQRGVLLNWKRTPEINCDYADLFAATPLFKVASPRMTRLVERLHKTAGIPSAALHLPVASRGGKNVFTVNTANMPDLRFRIQSSDLTDYPVIHFEDVFWDFMLTGMSPDVYANKVKLILKQIVPVEKISRRLFDIPSPRIGVHIRHRTAPDSLRISSLERFIEAMASCLEKQPATTFFLAADLPATERELRDRFGDKIVVSPKASYGKDQTGMYDAVVDLLMLSRCDRILGSYWSSFSDYAALIGGIDLEVIGVGPWPGPGQGILTRAEKYEKYGTEGWGQGWSPEGPPVSVS
jgi:hypothetical protein